LKPGLGRSVTLWILFFLICIGLGYPTLNRYDPRAVPGLYDSRAYYALVTGDPLQVDQEHFSHRVLVSYLAKPIFWLAKDHLHSWNPVFFALLVANSFFIATTAFMLVGVGRRISGNESAALVSGLLYLANFAVANFNLSGYVDSAVNCMMMAVVWTMLTERWWLLPIWGVLGATAKETFVPLAAALAFGWWLTTLRRGSIRLSQLAWIGAMVALGVVTLILGMSHRSSHASLLSFAALMRGESGSRYPYLSGLVRCLLAREFLYTFAWLLPLGIWRLRRLPKAWVVGSAFAALAALAMGAYDDALGGAARAVFSASGPLLSLSASLLLMEAGTGRGLESLAASSQAKSPLN
jgi:uncharacterized membrane protein